MRRLIAILMLLILVPTAASAEARVVIDEFAISRWVTENMQALNIPSIAVGIVGPDKDYYLETYGPAELDQPFLIGSLSKSVTALAVMLLVHDGVMKLEDSASQWVGGVPAAVTVRHLLHQTSGLARADDVEGWTELGATVEDLVARATFAAPGTYGYSNLNYNILGVIVAKASGKPYAEFVKHRIFDPAGMATASAQPNPPSGHVVGHQYMYGFPMDFGEPAYNPATVPAGFIWMAPNDMSRWIRLFVAKGKLDGKQVVPAAVVEQLLQKPDGSDYAMGWLIKTDGPTPYAKHTGATAAFTSAMSVVPDREFGVFVLTNLNLWMGVGATTILNGVMSPILGTPPSAATNIEFIVRLGFGLLVALIIFTFLFELLRWIRSGFPLRLSPRERTAIILTVLINVGVVIAVTQYFGTPVEVIITTQPDIGYGFLITVVVGTLRRVLTGFNKTAHLRALASDTDDE